MRRLYSTFAGGWPGTGLLLLRVVGGAALLVHSSSNLWESHSAAPATIYACLGLTGILLILGLWTPVAGAVAAFVVLGELRLTAHDRLALFLLGTIAAVLAMLGPGQWSVDARLFGWKRVNVPPRRSQIIAPPRPPA